MKTKQSFNPAGSVNTHTNQKSHKNHPKNGKNQNNAKTKMQSPAPSLSKHSTGRTTTSPSEFHMPPKSTKTKLKSPKNPKPSRNNNNTSSAEFVGFGVKTLDMLKSEAQPNNTTSTLYPPRPASSSSRSAPSSPKRKLDEIVDQKQMEECNPTAKRRSTSPTLESVTSTPPPPSSLNPLPAVRSTEESEEEDVEIDIVGDCEPINHIVQLSVATHEQFWSDADEEDMKSFGLLEKATITEAINDEDEKEFSQWLSD